MKLHILHASAYITRLIAFSFEIIIKHVYAKYNENVVYLYIYLH